MGRNENEPHPMSLDKHRTGDKPNRSWIGEGRREEAGQRPAPSQRSGGVSVDSTSVSSVKVSWEVSGGGCKTQLSEQAGYSREAGGVAGEVGVLRSSDDAPVMGVEQRRDTCPGVRSDGGRWLRRRYASTRTSSLTLTLVRAPKARTEPDSESRIWEIRPFGSMRGEVAARD